MHLETVTPTFSPFFFGNVLTSHYSFQSAISIFTFAELQTTNVPVFISAYFNNLDTYPNSLKYLHLAASFARFIAQPSNTLSFSSSYVTWQIAHCVALHFMQFSEIASESFVLDKISSKLILDVPMTTFLHFAHGPPWQTYTFPSVWMRHVSLSLHIDFRPSENHDHNGYPCSLMN